MRDRASFTAGWVAAARTLGNKLPREARIANDPFGASFVGRGTELFARYAPRFATRPFERFALYMQVRTRVIDDALRAFVTAGGRQILILGAGYDCRAARFSDLLEGVHVFEVDHPRTQEQKRAVLARTDARTNEVEYVAWDFESRALSELPDALASHHHDRNAPTLTIWEGVTMYLSEHAIEESVAAIAALSAPRSALVMTYFEKDYVLNPNEAARVVAKFVARGGEPFRFGFDPKALPAWATERGFHIAWDKTATQHAREVLPAKHAARVHHPHSHIALLEKQSEAIAVNQAVS